MGSWCRWMSDAACNGPWGYPVMGLGLPCNFLFVVASTGPACACERPSCIQGMDYSSSEPESNPRYSDVCLQLSTTSLPPEVAYSFWRVFHEKAVEWA